MSWIPVLQSGFEPPALVKNYLYTDPPIAGGWSENDVGPGTLSVVNNFARSGSQSMFGQAVAGESMAAEIYRNSNLKSFRINAWLFYAPGTNIDRQIIWFQEDSQTMQYLRVRPKSGGGSTSYGLEIGADSKITGFPGQTVPTTAIRAGEWINMEAWVVMASNPQRYVEVGVKLNGVEVYRKSGADFANTVIPGGYMAMNAVEIGPWGGASSPTEVYVDDVVISSLAAEPTKTLSVGSNPSGGRFSLT